MSRWTQGPTEVKHLLTIRPGLAKVKRSSFANKAVSFEKMTLGPHLGQSMVQYKLKAVETNKLSSNEKATLYEAMAMKGKAYRPPINQWQYEQTHLQQVQR